MDRPHSIIFSGPPADKFILLVKLGQHFHGCNSFGGFLSRSYYCHDCDKAYNNEDNNHHTCEGKWFPSGEKTNYPDFTTLKFSLPLGTFLKPSSPCHLCHRLFFGGTCFNAHLQCTKTKRSLCCYKKKCLACHKTYEAWSTEKNQTSGTLTSVDGTRVLSVIRLGKWLNTDALFNLSTPKKTNPRLKKCP